MTLMSILFGFLSGSAVAAERPAIGSAAPTFELKTETGKTFKLNDRRGEWTVLYFYPKDATPGCTKEACAFRDSVKLIRERSAEVFGISKDTVASHKKFSEKHKLNFSLLADEDGKVIEMYGASGFLGFAKRWTFIIDPSLQVRWVQTDVDPAINAKEVADELEKLQKTK